MYEDREVGVIIPVGSMFLLSSGQYSNYGIDVLCRSLVDVDVDAVRLEYLKVYPGQAKEYGFKNSAFINWFINEKKMAEEVDCWELRTSAYDDEYFDIKKPGQEERW